MFEGLRGPEMVAMVLGIALFVLVLAILIVYLVRKQPLTLPVVLFILPVVMILWPTIGSINYENGKLSVTHLTDKLAKNPADSATQKELITAMMKIDGRLPANRRGLIDTARAVILLSKASTMKLGLPPQPTRAGDDSAAAARINAIAAIDGKIAEVDTTKLPASGLKYFQALRNSQVVLRSGIAGNPGDTAAASGLNRGGLSSPTFTPERRTVRERSNTR